MKENDSEKALRVASILRLPIATLEFGSGLGTDVRIRKTLVKDYMAVSGIRFIAREHPRMTAFTWLEEKQASLLSTLTIGDWVEAYGNWPRSFRLTPTSATHRSLVPLCKLLLTLGLTPLDWPMVGVAITKEEIYAAHIERCGGDMNRLQDLSILVFGYDINSVRCFHRIFYREFDVDDSMLLPTITIRDLLTLDVETRCQRIHTESIQQTRGKLRVMGFDAQDGAFMQG